MKVLLDGTDVSRYAALLDPGALADLDLTNRMAVVPLVLKDRSDSLIPKEPRYGMQVQLYKDDGLELDVGGRISDLKRLDRAVRRAWAVGVQDHNVRLIETATGSLNKAGLVDWDRNFLIAALTDALKAQTFGASGATTDDPILTANELVNWSGIRAIARIVGKDWSYIPPSRVVDDIVGLVPNTSFRLRSDTIAEYASVRPRAPYVLMSGGSTAATSPDEPKRNSYREEVLVDAPLVYLRLGEGCNDATAADASGNARIGTYNGNPIRGRAGFADDWDLACLFDAVDDYVSVAHAAALNPAAISIEFLLYRIGGAGVAQNILHKGDDAGYAVRIDAANKITFRDRGATNLLTGATAIALGVVTHVVCVGDATGLAIYLNGVQDATNAVAFAAAPGATALEIGRSAAAGLFANAVIDEVAVYGARLSPARILTHAKSRFMRRVAHGEYIEQEIVGDHRNKMRRGGTGAAEETAFDESSYARFRRILDAGYVNDENIPASILRQSSYAELRTKRVRKTSTTKCWTRGAVPGQEIDVVSERLGSVGLTGHYVDVFLCVYGRDKSGVAKNYRGRQVVQKVSTAPLGNRKYELALQLGDNKRDMPTALAVLKAGGV